MKKTNSSIDKRISSLLSERLLVRKTFKIVGRIAPGARILYGETYDKYGITFDSLKYYLFLEYLARTVGQKVKCTVVEGDLHSIINPSVVEKDLLIREGRRRVEVIKRMLVKLKVNHVSVVLMSEMFSERKVMDLVNKVSTLVKNSVDLQEKLVPTVLKNRVAQERASGFRYAAEAIGLALNFTLKVGPLREENYDKVALLVGKKVGGSYGAVYLRPSYPLTSDFSFYLSHPEIEEYGLTPYKAGSNKMQDLRIVVGKTTKSEIRELVSTAYVPQNIVNANLLVDLATTVVMGEQIRQNNLSITELVKKTRELVSNREQLIERVIELLQEYI